MRAPILIVGLALAGAASAVPADAQSLADIARREAERRGSVPATAKVYTNEELTPDFTKPLAAEAPGEETAEASVTESPEAAPALPDGVDPASAQADVPLLPRPEKGEDYWRSRATLIRTRLERQRSEVESLQKRVNSLSQAEGLAAARERELAASALTKARSDLQHYESEWLSFERQARERNIPDAWIR